MTMPARVEASSSGRRRHGAPEADLQRNIVRFLRLVLPPGAVLHHSPHEVRGSTPEQRRRQAINAGMGVHAGWADLAVLLPGHVVFLEVKAGGGRQSEAQRRFQLDVEAQGHVYAVVRSIEEALAVLVNIPGAPLRSVKIGGRPP